MSELSVGSLSGLAANSYVIDVASGSTLDVTNATGTLPAAQLPAGSILQVVSTIKTDTFSTSSSSYVDVTGLSATITPTSASSKILILVNALISAEGNVVSSMLRISRGGTAIGVGDAAGNRRQTSSAAFYPGNDANDQAFATGGITLLDSPATTSSTTYTVQMVSGAATYVNRSSTDGDTTGSPRGSSTITLMEVAG